MIVEIANFQMKNKILNIFMKLRLCETHDTIITLKNQKNKPYTTVKVPKK